MNGTVRPPQKAAKPREADGSAGRWASRGEPGPANLATPGFRLQLGGKAPCWLGVSCKGGVSAHRITPISAALRLVITPSPKQLPTSSKNRLGIDFFPHEFTILVPQ